MRIGVFGQAPYLQNSHPLADKTPTHLIYKTPTHLLFDTFLSDPGL